MTSWFLVLTLAFSASLPTAQAQVDSLRFKQALKLKKNFYLGDGSFTGGDRASSDFTVSNVRVASNPEGYDRVVIDLSGNRLGEKSKLSRPPFFLVEVDPALKRINVTLYGKPKIDFSTMTALRASRKGTVIKEFEFIPLVEQDRWTWVIHTFQAPKAEVFELTDPARIIIDVKR